MRCSRTRRRGRRAPWSPLARGWLARPPSDKKATDRGEEDSCSPQLYDDPQSDTIIERVDQVAENRGISRAQVALAWLRHQPAVTAPIVGATKMEHLEDAIGAVDVELTDHEIELLEEPYEPRPVRGHE